MDRITGFPPIANDNATILILGSMPSETSLKKQQYYGYQRNAFWPIMLALFGENGIDVKDYSQRKEMLIKSNIALWDVLQSCHREGSLDTAIIMNSIKINDFLWFFSKHRTINKVFFNGGKAETIFNKYVLSKINQQFGYIQFSRLPSTSPAYANMTVQEKIGVWGKEILAG